MRGQGWWQLMRKLDIDWSLNRGGRYPIVIPDELDLWVLVQVLLDGVQLCAVIGGSFVEPTMTNDAIAARRIRATVGFRERDSDSCERPLDLEELLMYGYLHMHIHHAQLSRGS